MPFGAMLVCTIVSACGGPSGDASVEAIKAGRVAKPVAAENNDRPADAICVEALVFFAESADGELFDSRSRAERALDRLHTGEPFERLVNEVSEDPDSRVRGGVLGTYPLGAWPSLYAAVAQTLASMPVHATTEAISVEGAVVVARRCIAEFLHLRQIVVRFGNGVRTEAEASERAEGIRARLELPAFDFAGLAREYSEDSSAADGGELGHVGRGVLSPELEAAAARLAPGELSPVLVIDGTFRILQRHPER